MNERIIAAVDDIFFAAKIRATAERLGLKVNFARDMRQLEEALRGAKPGMIIFDLHSQRCDAFSLAERLKGDAATRDIPLVGFFSHVQTELRRRALDAGIDHVMPRSAFNNNLPQILRGEII